MVIWIALMCAQADGLGEAATKAAVMTNYTFQVSTVREESGGGGRPMEFTGGADAGVLHVQNDRIDAYRKGETLVVKGEDGRWSVAEPPAKGEKPEKGQRGVMMLRTARPPHEELTGLETKLENVMKTEEEGKTVYSGSLTSDGAAQFGTPAGRRPGGPLAFSGNAKVWVDGQGVIVKYELTIQAKGKLKDKEIDATTTRTVEIRDVGTTKLEIPEEVGALLNP